ncbi:unnamed protein product [Vicia faba]|uniref:Putative E3 ubiquitin-protein ligase LIN N-terminal domain-containing protein n=1 Tax=Vicia faba TaxID=3906 RepID=A0AAV1B7I1_VICFA|nr:unnamed protein product [Vicia faba]
MTSLKQLLTQEGFIQTNKLSKETKEIITSTSLPLSFQPNTQRVCSSSETSNSKSLVSPDSRREGPPMDEVAIRALISILSDYVGRYIKDSFFRKTLFVKCNSYLVRRKTSSESDNENETLVNMKHCLESIDKLVQNQGSTKKELKISFLRNSIELLTIIASLNSNSLQGATTCGIPNSHLSACGQLYMAILYKHQKNNRVCARHLMQVFCDAPFLARTYLVPEFWQHLFLPHLLHVKIWYIDEVETISDSNECDGEKEEKMKCLGRVYNNKVDIGTIMFALYYKQWLQVGTSEPSFPVVPLPTRP